MKKLLLGAALALGITMVTGCVATGGPTTTTAIGVGGIVLDHKAPASFDIDNSVKAVKCGTAKSKGIVFFVTGDSSIKAAMDNGGIKKVHHIDYETMNIFNIYTEATTTIWGE